MKSRSEKEILEEINKKLDRLIAIIAVQGQDPETKIKFLQKLGFSSYEIGALTGLSPSGVRMRNLRNKRKK